MSSYVQNTMRSSIKLTEFEYIGHTEQEIGVIIRTSVFCVDKTCFPSPVTNIVLFQRYTQKAVFRYFVKIYLIL